MWLRSNLMFGSFAGYYSRIPYLSNQKNLQYKRFYFIKKIYLALILSQNYRFSINIFDGILREKPMAYFIWPWCLLGSYLAQAIKEWFFYIPRNHDWFSLGFNWEYPCTSSEPESIIQGLEFSSFLILSRIITILDPLIPPGSGWKIISHNW